MIAPARRRLWSLFAVAGIVIGALVLISGDRSGHHSIRLLGALIMAGGCLCAVVRLARDSPRHLSPYRPLVCISVKNGGGFFPPGPSFSHPKRASSHQYWICA